LNLQIVQLLNAVPDGRVFALDAQMFLSAGLQLLNVAVLAYVMWRLLYKPVRKFLQGRTDKVAAQLARAADDTAKAGDLKSQYEQKIKDVGLERDEILESARKQAAEKAKQILAEAKTEADAIKARADLEINLERERVKDEMKQAILDVSAAMTEKYVVLALDKQTHDRLFAEAVAELEATPFSRAR
jgi:F-type H+-transporting ATPase subunit b